jgi:glutamate-ammonia-ligase adenylyltransferase
VTAPLERRLGNALAGTALADRFPTASAPFLGLRAGDAAAKRLEGAVLAGLARALASQPEVSGFLSHRPELLERIAAADASSLAARARELQSSPAVAESGDLEAHLDALRILRREETCLAACLDLGGVVSFEEVSDFLSMLAETIAQRALELAREGLSPSESERVFSVLGMGKIAGREFSYHSDLDLIFLYQGGAEEIDTASRLGQRLIAYLTTMTGAGVAYAVDTRLRPSGQQGTLVTSFEAFERYQCDTAQTWEHLAMLRARPIAGAVPRAQQILDRVRARVLSGGGRPWKPLAQLRRRVVAERAQESGSAISLKTGPGGLMDVDFLAGGALLERGTEDFPTLPSVAAMLRAAARGDRVDRLLADYRFLRIVEARARWVAGRAIEALDTASEGLGAVAALVEPGMAPGSLLEEIASARRGIREAYDAVIEADTIDAVAP